MADTATAPDVAPEAPVPEVALQPIPEPAPPEPETTTVTLTTGPVTVDGGVGVVEGAIKSAGFQTGFALLPLAGGEELRVNVRHIVSVG